MIKVLVIEDNDADSELVAISLREVEDIKIVRVKDILGFRRVFKPNEFNAILSDYNLPDGYGTDILKWVREAEPDIPFIIITGILGDEKAVDILRMGATDYVLKANLYKLSLILARSLKAVEQTKAEQLAAQKLRLSEERLMSINQNSPDLIITVNLEGVITYSNRYLATDNTEGIIGKNVLDFISDKYKNIYKNHLSEAFKGIPQEFEIRAHAEDGGLAWYAVRMAAESTRDLIDSVLIISTDISHRKEALIREEVINNISNELSKDISLDVFLKMVRLELGKIFRTDNFYMSSYNEQLDELTFIFHYSLNEPDPDIPHSRVNGNGLSEFVIKTKRSLLLLGDTIDEFQQKRGIIAHMENTLSWMGVPVMHDNVVLGVLAVLSFDNDKAFTEKDKELLTFVGSQIGSFIRSKEAEQKLKDSQLRWDSLVQNSSDIILTVTRECIIDYVNKLPPFFAESGLEMEHILGQRFDKFSVGSKGAEIMGLLEKSLRDESNCSFIFEGLRTGRYYDCTASPLIQEGRVNGLIIIMRNITDLMLAQKEIKESEERYRNVVQDQVEYIVRWKSSGEITFANKSYLDFIEMPLKSLLKKNYFSLIPKNQKQRFENKIKKLTPLNPVAVDSHQSSRGKSGDFWNEWVDRAFFDEKGEVIEYQSVGRDISVQKRAELEIKRSEEFKQSILSALFCSIAVINTKGIIISANDAWTRFTLDNEGSVSNTNIGASYFDACNNSIKAGDKIAFDAMAGIQKVLHGKAELFELEYPCHSQSEQRWFLMRVTPFNGEAGGAVIAHYDISEQKNQQKRIVESESKYRSLFEKMHEGLFVSGEDGILQMINPQFAEMLGYTEEEMVGKNGYLLLMNEHERSIVQPKVYQRKMGISESYETKLIKKDGSFLHVNLSSSPIYNDSGAFIGIMSIVSDISARKNAEIRLKLSYNEIRNFEKISNAVIQGRSLYEISETILQGLNIFSEMKSSTLYLYNEDQSRFELTGSIINADLDSTIEGMNGLKLNSINHSIDLDPSFAEIIHKREALITIDKQQIKELLTSFSAHIAIKDLDKVIESKLNIQTVGVLPISSGERVLGAIVFTSGQVLNEFEIKSIVRFSQHAGAALAKKMTEEELSKYKENLERLVAIRTNRLNEINGELEAFNYSVSHDLRTPVRAIDIYRGLLAEELKDSPLLNYINQIERCTNEMNELIKSLLEFSKMTKAPISIGAVDLNTLVKNSFKKQKEFENVPNVRLKMEKMPIILADHKLLAIVMNNLLSNAIKYSSSRKTPCVEVGFTDSDKNYIIYVKDNGVGFDTHLANKLFKPFSRLHHGDKFKGTGAGLAIVERILRRHNGKIYAESEVDKGAVFYFTLPKKYDHIQHEEETNYRG